MYDQLIDSRLGYQSENMEMLLYLCVGVLVGGFLQLAMPITLIFIGLETKIDLEKNEELNAMYTLFIPGLVGAAILQVNAFISGVLALMIDDSASAIIYLAHRL